MGVVDRGGVGRAHAVEEEVNNMPLDDLAELGDLGSWPAFLGPPVQAGDGIDPRRGPLDKGPYDLQNFILPKKHGMYGIPGGRPGPMPADSGATIPGGSPGPTPLSFGNDMGTPVAVSSASASSGFDLSSIFSGTIMGIPTWLILAAAAYFLFFKKGR